MNASTSIPDQIGRYEIRAVLGRGGMGTVFHAYDPRFERDVALKVLPFHLLGHEGLRARFEREAKTIASLEHPAIVPVYDFDEHEGQPFLVMRLMPGGTLADRLAHGSLPTGEVVRILQRIGSALDEAHAQGIIHRDLKPGNILFDKYGHAYLSDFGIVRLVEGTGIDLTGTGMVGTPGYMSPEQIQGKTIDGRTDIYALGVLVFEMLTARKPFTADTPAMLMMKQITEPIPDIHELRPDLPAEINAVIERSLSRRREERPATAGELAGLVQVVAASEAATAAGPAAATPAEENLPEPTSKAALKSEPESPSPVPPTKLEPATPPLPPPPASARADAVAATVVATPPLDVSSPAASPTAAPPAGASSRRRWLPALIGVVGVFLVMGVIGAAVLIFSQLSDGGEVAEVAEGEPIAEPAGDTDAENGGNGVQPEDVETLNVDQALAEAFQALEGGDYEAALAMTNDILEADPENIPALEIRHFAFRDLGRFDEALAAAGQMIALEPENPDFYGERAVTKDWSGDTHAAVGDAEQCLELDPEHAGCWFLLGTFYQLLGDLPAARDAWLQSLEIEPDNGELSRELAWLFIQIDNDLERAIEFVDRAVELDPEIAANWHARGHIAAAAGEEFVAVESYQRYLEMVPAGECDDCVAEAEAFLAEHEAPP